MFTKRLASSLTTLGVVTGLLVGAGGPATAENPYDPSDPNPGLTAQCGLDFALILDSSGSIGSNGMKNLVKASDAFTEALVDTGSTVSVTSFSTQSPGFIDNQGHPGHNLVPTALTSANLSTVQGSYNTLVSSGMTNWQDGFLKAQAGFSGFTPDGAPNLAILITDGNANTYNNPNGGTSSPGDGAPAAVNPAIKVANQMKGVGVHMFGIAVGDGLPNLDPIKAVTSDEELNTSGSNFATAGYTKTDNYAALAKTLKSIAVELCAPSLTINKVVTSSSSDPTPADGWTFDTTVTIPNGDGTWVKPGNDAISAGVASTKSATTAQGGAATFQWEPNGNLVTDPVLVKEQTKSGYTQVPTLDCVAKNLLADTKREFKPTLDSTGVWNLGSIDPKEIVTCTATNFLKDTGSLTITKEFNAQASGYAGTFDIAYSCVDGVDKVKAGTVSLAAGKSETISGLPTGTTCTVTEPKLPANPSGWTFNSPTLTPSNGQATITKKDEVAAVTVTNSVSQVSPVVVKKICPVNVTLHQPKAKKVGNKVLIDKITTKKSACVLLKPVVLCRPLAANAAGETSFCDTKVTSKGKVKVNAGGYDAVKVTVAVRAKPKPGLSDQWKPKNWKKTWVLK